MPKPKDAPLKLKCPGGLSQGRMTEDHQLGKVHDVVCFRCDARMGCSACVRPKRELICLKCRDWASRKGLDAHGPIVRDRGIGLLAFQVVNRAWSEGLSPEQIDQEYFHLFGR